ncbi:hypothetical protein D3C78_1482380 [compost metagenome]
MHQKVCKAGFRWPVTRALTLRNPQSTQLMGARDRQHREVVKPSNRLTEATDQLFTQRPFRQIHFKHRRHSPLPRVTLKAHRHGQRDGVFFLRVLAVGKH